MTIRDVLLIGSCVDFARELRREGYTVWATPDTRWDLDETPLYTRDKALEEVVERRMPAQARRWLKGHPERAVFDTYSQYLKLAEFAANSGAAYLGADTQMERLETSRKYGQTVMRAVGIPCGQTYSVRSTKARERLMPKLQAEYENDGTLYVVKKDAPDYFEFDKVLVPTSFTDFEWAVRHHQPPVSLEEKISGIEVAFTVMVVDGQIIPLHTNFEHKNTHNGNLGVPAGEMGTLIVRGIAPRVMQALWEPLAARFAGKHIRTHVDINCIYDPIRDRLVPLEFTMRFGEPTAMLFTSMIARPAEQHVRWAQGIVEAPEWRANAAVGVMVVPGGYPHVGACLQHIPMRIGEMAHAVFKPIWRTVHPEWGFAVHSGRQGVLVAVEQTVALARQHAYEDLRQVHFDTIHYRTDIASQWPAWRTTLHAAGLLTDEQATF
jgi:phosphoribosylamine-glycine ligase